MRTLPYKGYIRRASGLFQFTCPVHEASTKATIGNAPPVVALHGEQCSKNSIFFKATRKMRLRTGRIWLSKVPYYTASISSSELFARQACTLERALGGSTSGPRALRTTIDEKRLIIRTEKSSGPFQQQDVEDTRPLQPELGFGGPNTH